MDHSNPHGISRRSLLHLSKLPAAALFAATKLVYGPLNRARGTQAFARRLFYNDYLAALARFGWREQHTIVFDHLVAPTAYYIPRAEFEEWWRDIGAEEVSVGWHNSNSWRGWGKISRESGVGSLESEVSVSETPDSRLQTQDL